MSKDSKDRKTKYSGVTLSPETIKQIRRLGFDNICEFIRVAIRMTINEFEELKLKKSKTASPAAII